MSKKITEKVTWVGKVDWELTHFHGDELSTFKGSSYNSYLIKDKKTVLIDTIWTPHRFGFVENLKKENLRKLLYFLKMEMIIIVIMELLLLMVLKLEINAFIILLLKKDCYLENFQLINLIKVIIAFLMMRDLLIVFLSSIKEK